MPDLAIFKTYNARIVSGSVRRGTLLDDWFQYGLYYGQPQYLQVHEFGNWSMIVFDIAALGMFDPDVIGVPVLIYLPFGSRFRRYATLGGHVAPDYNAAEIGNFIAAYKAQIDTIISTYGCAGIFWDECDSGYWDTGYTIAGATFMRDVLEELCDYVRSKGGQNIVNGTPWYAKPGEIFLLESFIGSYFGNAFAPAWRYNSFFLRYGYTLEDNGEAGGIPWSTGLFAYLYVWKHAYTEGEHGTLMFGHAYGDPASAFQNYRQATVYAAFRALGIRSVNYIDPANQKMRHLYMHQEYLGAPLETPQFDVAHATVARRFSGGAVLFDDTAPDSSTITRTISPDYWWHYDRPFSGASTTPPPVPWEDGQNYPDSDYEVYLYAPTYLRIEQLTTWDDRDVFYIRILFSAAFEETDLLPVYLYLNLDPAAMGYQQFRSTATGFRFMEFRDLAAQVYLYGNGIFKWEGNAIDNPAWRFLYTARYEKTTIIDGGVAKDVVYYAIRKETLRFVCPTWDGHTVRMLAGFVGSTGSGFQVPEPMQLMVETGNQYIQVRGYLTHTMQTPIAYVPHNAVIYGGAGNAGGRITSVAVEGSFHKGWLFDRETGRFVGPDNTPGTYWTESPFTPAKDIDAQDSYVLLAYDSAEPDDDGFAVSGVSVTTEAWEGAHAAGYDVPLPDLVRFTDIYEQWKDERMPSTAPVSFAPLGFERGLIKFEKDNLRADYTLRVAITDDIMDTLATYDIRGVEVDLSRISAEADFTNPDHVERLLIGVIESWDYTDGILTLTIRQNLIDWSRSYPNRRLSYFCPYTFKDSRCKYEGVEGFCDKTFTTCQSFENAANFGGFKTLPRLQRGKWQ